MFIIRADGNSVIGMGHVMRCLSIADAMKQLGMESLFVTACQECVSVIEQRGFQVKLLTTDYRDMLSEIPQLAQILQQENAENVDDQEDDEIKKHVIFVDSYQVNVAYYRELNKLARTVCLEDMGQPYPVDMLINYNIYGDNLAARYEDDCINKPKQTLLGISYMPLRKEFSEDISYHVRGKVTDVMITTGGGDPLFAAKDFVSTFLANEDLQKAGIRYHIISGPFNNHATELKTLYGKNTSVMIHENVKSMKEIMRQCDVVLTATGSTIYEVSALGVPMMVFYFAENQRQGAEEIEKRTSVINCGDFSKEPEQVVDKAVAALIRCVQEKNYRQHLYQQEKQLVDGKGACRIATALQKIAKKGEALL